MSDFYEVLPQLTDQLSAHHVVLNLQKLILTNVIFEELESTFTPRPEILAKAKRNLSDDKFVEARKEEMAHAVLAILAEQIPSKIKALQADNQIYLEDFLELRQSYLTKEQEIKTSGDEITLAKIREEIDKMTLTIDSMRAEHDGYKQIYHQFKDITVENLRDRIYMDKALRAEIFRDAFTHVPEVTNNFINEELLRDTLLAEQKHIDLRIEGYSPQAILDDPQAFIDGLQAQRQQIIGQLHEDIEKFVEQRRSTMPPSMPGEAHGCEHARSPEEKPLSDFQLLQKRAETIRSQIEAAEDAGYIDRATARRMNKSLDRTDRDFNRRSL